MDKYQKYILDKFRTNNSHLYIFSSCHPLNNEETDQKKEYGFFDSDTDTFNIKQDDDITKTKYILTIEAITTNYICFDNVYILKNNQWFEALNENAQYIITIDFNDRIDAIKFVFENHIADDYTLKIEYTEADKNKYYAKIEQEKKEALEKAANIKVSLGADLVNIYFLPCCAKYDHTEICLFVANNSTSSKNDLPTMIKKCNVPLNDFFISINGLAYGKYYFVLKQYDKQNNVILETQPISFAIIPPNNHQWDCII